MQSIYSLTAAMSSFSAMKTVNAVKGQLEGRSGILKAEIASGNGDLESKQEELEENEQKIQKVGDNLNQNLMNINKELNRPQTEEEKEKALEAKRAEKKAAEKTAEENAAQEAAGEQTGGVPPQASGTNAPAASRAPAGSSVDTVEFHAKAQTAALAPVTTDTEIVTYGAGAAADSFNVGQGLDVFV